MSEEQTDEDREGILEAINVIYYRGCRDGLYLGRQFAIRRYCNPVAACDTLCRTYDLDPGGRALHVATDLRSRGTAVSDTIC